MELRDELLELPPQESQKLLQAILDNSSNFIGLLTPDGRVLEANQTALNFIEADKSEVIDRFFWETPWWSHSAEMQQMVKEAIAQAAQGQTVRCEVNYSSTGVIPAPFDFSLTPIKNKMGQVILLIPEGHNISDLKSTEDMLRQVQSHLEGQIAERTAQLMETNRQLQQEVIQHQWAVAERDRTLEMLQLMMERMPMGCIMNAPDFRVSFWNDAAERIFGYTKEEVLGKLLYETFVPTFSEAHIQQIQQRMMRGERDAHSVHQNVTKDGRTIWCEWHYTPLINSNREFLGFLTMVQDITEQKSLEQKIGDQAMLLDVASDAIYVRDNQNRIVYWNRGAERLYGWSAAAAIGQDATRLLYKDPAQVRPILEIVYAKGDWQGEVQKLTQSGKEVAVNARLTLVRDEAGQPKSILTVDTDITEKKQLEAQFLRAQRLESLGTLASGIAHDLNNIFTPILVVAQLLPIKFPALDEQHRQMLTLLEENAKRGVDLIKQILAFARGAEGKRTVLQPGHILAEIAKIARQTFPKTIEVQTHFSTQDLSQISADPTQLHQVLINLCVNARDAMPNGGILTIAACNCSFDEAYAQMNLEAKPENYVMVTVGDTGIGILPENLDRIFDPFFTTKEPGQGTGLGLSTVLGIVRSHGGFVQVQSKVGKGTQFKVYLPEVKGDTPRSSAITSVQTGHNELILIVDDEPTIGQITKTSLEENGYRALVAHDGLEAIALYARHDKEISVILMDIVMPSVNGIVAARAIQKINPQARIIAVSGLESNFNVATLAEVNIAAFLAKPYTVNELLNALQQAISASP